MLLTCRYLVKPASSLICVLGSSAAIRAIRKQPDEAMLIAHATLLFGVVAAATYAGTSNLFAAYLAGASISWYDSDLAQPGDVEKIEHIEITTLVATGTVQKATCNDSNVTENETPKIVNDGTGRGEQLARPRVASTNAMLEPDGQNHKTEQAQSCLSGVSI